MKSRRDRLARAKEINNQLWRLKQIQLAQAESEVAALRDAESASLELLAHSEPRILLPYIVTLARRRAEAEAALLQAQERAREYGRRMKLTEKLHRTAEEIARREEEAFKFESRADTDDVRAR